MLLDPGVPHRDSFAKYDRFFYDVQIQLRARQLSAQPGILRLNLADRSLCRYRATRSRFELTYTAEPDPIP